MGGLPANATYFLQTHRDWILSGDLFDLPVEFFDTLVKSLQVSPQSKQ